MPQRRATRAHTSRHDNMARSVSNDAKSRRNRVPPLAGTMSMTTARDEQDDMPQRRATRAHTSRHDNMARSVSNDAKSRRNRVPPLAGTMSMTTARDEQDDVRQRRATRAHTSRLDNMACAPPLADITNTRMSRGKHQHATAVSLLNATRAREQDDRSTPPKKLRPSDGVTQPPPSTMTLPTPTLSFRLIRILQSTCDVARSASSDAAPGKIDCPLIRCSLNRASSFSAITSADGSNEPTSALNGGRTLTQEPCVRRRCVPMTPRRQLQDAGA
ncbi:hypothetical protein RI054_03g16270 [Pseudoscourfieldia marina]